jgi:hypothetical protein
MSEIFLAGNSDGVDCLAERNEQVKCCFAGWLCLTAAGRGGLCCVSKNFFMIWRSIIYFSHHISRLDSEGACSLICKLQYRIMLVECGGEKRAGKVLICLLTMSYNSLWSCYSVECVMQAVDSISDVCLSWVEWLKVPYSTMGRIHVHVVEYLI